MNEDIKFTVSANDENLKGLTLIGAEKEIIATHGTVTPVNIFVKVPRKNLTETSQPITFMVEGKDKAGNVHQSDRASVFIGPKR